MIAKGSRAFVEYLSSPRSCSSLPGALDRHEARLTGQRIDDLGDHLQGLGVVLQPASYAHHGRAQTHPSTVAHSR